MEGLNLSYISSIEIADKTNTRHTNVLSAIRNIIEKNKVFYNNFFIKSFYKDSRGREKPIFLLDKEGFKIYVDNKRKDVNLSNLLEYANNIFMYECTSVVLSSRFEDSFNVKLKEALKPLGYSLKTQLHILNYFVDFYIPEVNLVVEYDEHHHNTSTNTEKDNLRQKEIEQKLHCSFVRCSYVESDAFNIGVVFKSIYTLHFLSSTPNNY